VPRLPPTVKAFEKDGGWTTRTCLQSLPANPVFWAAYLASLRANAFPIQIGCENKIGGLNKQEGFCAWVAARYTKGQQGWTARKI